MRLRIECVAAVLLLAGVAHANSAARPVTPTTSGGSFLPGKTPLRIASEDLSFDCDTDGNLMRCRFVARYDVVNPTGQPHSVVGAFYGIAAEDVVVRVDGTPSKRDLSLDDVHAFDERVAGLEADEVRPYHERVDRIGFELTVPAEGRRELRVDGVLVDRSGTTESLATDAIYGRHLAFGTPDFGRRFDFAYLLSPIRTWSGAPKVHVTLRYPRRFARVRGPYAEGDASFHESDEGGTHVVTGTFDDDTMPESILFGFRETRPFLSHGGPFLAVGSAGDDEKRTRLRVGWEVARPRWLLYSLQADFDFRGRVIAAPVVSAASQWITIIPSIGLGLGVPVQVAPTLRAGLRLQFDAMIAACGLLASMDVFPDRVETALMFKISL